MTNPNDTIPVITAKIIYRKYIQLHKYPIIVACLPTRLDILKLLNERIVIDRSFHIMMGFIIVKLKLELHEEE